MDEKRLKVAGYLFAGWMVGVLVVMLSFWLGGLDFSTRSLGLGLFFASATVTGTLTGLSIGYLAWVYYLEEGL